MSTKINLEQIPLSDIFPELEEDRVKQFLQEFNPSLLKDIPQEFDLDELPQEIVNLLNRVFITRTLNRIPAIKARFLNNMDMSEQYKGWHVAESQLKVGSSTIDLCLTQDSTKRKIWVFFFEFLDKIGFERFAKSLQSNVSAALKKNQQNFELPDEVYLIASKLERRTAADQSSLPLGTVNVPVSFVIEYTDSNREFDDLDYILVDRYCIRGFNFSSMEDVLSFLKTVKGKGKYTIRAENVTGEKRIIWEGLLFPQDLFTNKRK